MNSEMKPSVCAPATTISTTVTPNLLHLATPSVCPRTLATPATPATSPKSPATPVTPVTPTTFLRGAPCVSPTFIHHHHPTPPRSTSTLPLVAYTFSSSRAFYELHHGTLPDAHLTDVHKLLALHSIFRCLSSVALTAATFTARLDTSDRTPHRTQERERKPNPTSTAPSSPCATTTLASTLTPILTPPSTPTPSQTLPPTSTLAPTSPATTPTSASAPPIVRASTTKKTTTATTTATATATATPAPAVAPVLHTANQSTPPNKPHLPASPSNHNHTTNKMGVPHSSQDEMQKVLPSVSELQRINYIVHITTANVKGAGTDKDVRLRLIGDLSSTETIVLSKTNPDVQSYLHKSSDDSKQQDSSRNTRADRADVFFPIASTRQFSIRTPDLGNLLSIRIQHDAEVADPAAAWKPNRILVQNDSLHRSWSFLCARWLTFDLGNIIDLVPSGDIALGRRASNKAFRRISSAKSPRLPSIVPGSKKLFETMRERFSGTPDHAADVSLANQSGTRRVLFQLQRYSQTASHLYLTGSIPALGAWRPEHACRMMRHSPFAGRWRGDWRLEVEIDDDYDEIRYQYMVVREGESPQSRVATFTHPVRVLKLSAGDRGQRNAEGSPIYVKDVFQDSSAPGTPQVNTPRHTSLRHGQTAVINTPRGDARVMANENGATPMRSPRAMYSLVQRDLQGALESSTADPVSSDTSISHKAGPRPLPSAATEESSAPLEDSDCDRRSPGRETDDSPAQTARKPWVVEELDFGTEEARWTGTRQTDRRQSADISSDSMSSEVQRGAGLNDSPYVKSLTQSTPRDSSPISSEDHARVPSAVGGNAQHALRSEAKLREERDGLQSERDSLREQLDAMKREFEAVLAARDASSSDLEASHTDIVSGQKSDDQLAEPTQVCEERDELRASLESLRAEHDSTRDERDAMRAERDAALEHFEVLQREKDEVAEEREALKSEMDELRNEREGEESVAAERDALAAELADLRSSTSEKTEEYSKMTSTHQELVDELEGLRTVVAENRVELDAHSAELEGKLAVQQEEFDASLQVVEAERTTIQERWAREFKARRKLFNTLQELRGNIRVFCRVRPLKEGAAFGRNMSVSFPDSDFGEHGRIQLNGKVFEFDHVFQPTSTQEQVYEETAGVVASVLDGYNVCVFAYGQTGSGKTYTMDGSDCNRGVNYRALENLFGIADERRDHSHVTIFVSMLEIYNENLRDLITPENGADGGPKLEIRRDPTGSSPNAVYVPNLSEVEVESFEHTWDVMMQGSLNRSQGRTDMNEHSSRSHLILRVTVQCENFETGVKSSGVLHLVDLAGSERVSRSNASGERLREAQHINKSLSSLGDVFSALTSNSGHVPYRNSRLTYLLQDCLGGDSKTLMFVNVSCDEADGSETNSSLLFAQRVAKVELRGAKKHTESTVGAKASAALQEKESENDELKGKVGGLQREMKKRDECILEMRQRLRTMESEVTRAKQSAEESAKDSSDLEGVTRELEELRAHVELKESDIERLAEEVQRKDAEIDELRALVAAPVKAVDETAKRKLLGPEATVKAPVAKSSAKVVPKQAVRMERMSSAPVIGRGERPSASRIPRTGSAITGRPPRQVRFDESEAQTKLPEKATKKGDEASGSTSGAKTDSTAAATSTTSANGTSSGGVGGSSSSGIPAAPRRTNSTLMPRTQSGLPRATSLRTASRVPAPSARKSMYAFGSRVDSGLSDKGSGTAGRSRVPRSQTAILRPPQRANGGSANGALGRSSIPGPGGRVTSGLRRAGTLSTMKRNAGGGGGAAGASGDGGGGAA